MRRSWTTSLSPPYSRFAQGGELPFGVEGFGGQAEDNGGRLESERFRTSGARLAWNDIQQLIRMMDAFIAGEGRSRDFVSKMEGEFAACGLDGDERSRDLQLALAMFGAAGWRVRREDARSPVCLEPVERSAMTLKRLLLTISIVLALASARVHAQGTVSFRPQLTGPDALAKWSLDGSGSWVVIDGKLVLEKAGKPAGPIRRPAALAIFKTDPLQRVTLTAEVRSTAPQDVLRRDVNLIFGYESPSRFYYVHLSGITDAVHHGIFLVAGADRRRIDDGKGQPQLKDQNWHRVRLERDGGTGRVEIYVDESKAPVLVASDTTIPAGRVGLGSFDDTGEFRGIEIAGSK